MSMTFLLGSFFLVEVIIGYITNSMALIADSFHMLSDVASLVVGYLALKYSTVDAPKDKYTYGYARAEVLGALVNAVFLVALCFSITIEALKRLVIIEPIEDPMLVLIVGLVGIFVNAIGLFLFHQAGHSHGGHGHSHGGGGGSHGHSHGGGGAKKKKGHGHSYGDGDGHGHSHGSGGGGHSHGAIKAPGEEQGSSKNKVAVTAENTAEQAKEATKDKTSEAAATGEANNPFIDETGEEKKNLADEDKLESKVLIAEEATETDQLLPKDKEGKCSGGEDHKDHEHGEGDEPPKKKMQSAAQLNIEGVYLHILGDAIGSVIVMISALIIMYGVGDWTLYVDPALSLVMVAIILKTSIPLLKESSKILMNSVPHHIQVEYLKEEILRKFPAVTDVHELHVWQLAGDKIIASAHIKLSHKIASEQGSHNNEVINDIKAFFHEEGIHSTTIQLEFHPEEEEGEEGEGNASKCMVLCSLEGDSCEEKMCCKPVH